MTPSYMTDPALWAALAALGWSALAALARRWLSGVENKLDEQAAMAVELQAAVAESRGRNDVAILSVRIDEARRAAVGREEYALMVANLNLKLEAIGDRLDEINDRQRHE